MSLSKRLNIELARLGCKQVEPLVFDVPSYDGAIDWRLSFKTLGFTKGRVGGALRYRHRIATDFGWLCLSQLGGPLLSRAEAPPWGFSGGVPFGLMAGWRADWTIDSPSSQHEATAQRIAADVQANVLPFVLNMQSDEDLFRLLLQDSEPWSWQRSQPLSRFAEVACIAKILNVPASVFLPLAEKHSFQMQDQLDSVDLATFIDGVMQKVEDVV
ncbi:hypothetical protein [Variovorax sp. IB41]|uniref:hypothetical protein n=1 Tax=Variovorax sp. IB41 TaxID=2779370 RepID=UPI0018E7F8B0|nr:hypothetical protein [Variovorax sp. IB41]MBJ2155099.1 hypothetical protein [Variovorax sp. IB41]